MFERNIYDEYKLYCEQRFMLGDYEGFSAQNKHYFLVCVDELEDSEISEMIQMASHLQARGDHEVAQYIPTIHQTLTGFVDGQNSVLFQLPQFYSRSKSEKSIGYELARFHRRGVSYPTVKKQQGTWSQFWINRLSQLDLLYQKIAVKKTKSIFDQVFMISFPYYLGRTENAIQYIGDTDLDLGKQSLMETKTICHYRFTPRTWMTIDHDLGASVKNPVEFVYDYPSRDLAEWIREIASDNRNPFHAIEHFINEYKSVEQISLQSWRYIYGRLLFPIEYYQVVEGYYRAMNDDLLDEYIDQLFDLLNREREVELFLRSFHEQVIPSSLFVYVPKIDWLSNDRRRNES